MKNKDIEKLENDFKIGNTTKDINIIEHSDMEKIKKLEE
jgi:hypothetical protein